MLILFSNITYNPIMYYYDENMKPKACFFSPDINDWRISESIFPTLEQVKQEFMARGYEVIASC